MSKNKKIMLGICLPVIGLGTVAGTAGVILSIGNRDVSNYDGDYLLSFNAGKGAHFKKSIGSKQKVYAGTPLDRLPQPEVESYRANTLFSGWVDENNNRVFNKTAINRDTKLTATYANLSDGNYHTITFRAKDDEEGKHVVLNGNCTVAAKKDFVFLMINRPTATCSVDGQEYVFKQWSYFDESTGSYIAMPQNQIIDKDYVLYAEFTPAVKVTFDPGEGGMIQRGQSSTTLSTGSTFSKFNQPQLVNTDLNKYFQYWTLNGEKVDEDAPIYDNTTVVAKWDTRPDPTQTNNHMLQYDTTSEAQKGITAVYYPSNITYVESGTTWGATQKPQSITTEDGWHEVTGFEYQDASGWHALEDSHVFANSGSTIETTHIRPIFASSISSIEILGTSELLPESETDYTAIVYGSATNPSVSSEVEWSVTTDEEGVGEAPEGISVGKTTGIVNVTSLTQNTECWLHAKSAKDSSVKGKLHIDVKMPYEKSQLTWTHLDGKWWWMSQTSLCYPEARIVLHSLADDSYTQEIDRSTEFTSKIYIGRQLDTIEAEFGINWTGLNAEIDLGNVKYIGNNFLDGCTNFNNGATPEESHPLDIGYVETIGKDFLYGCTNFNQQIKFTYGDTNNQNINTIGDNFLGNCINFNNNNKEFKFGSEHYGQFNIGSGFLYNCQAFNKKITLVDYITSIGDFFMTNCREFSDEIVVNMDVNNIANNINSIAAFDGDAAIATSGFKVSGANASAFTTQFPSYNKNNAHRSIKESTGEKGVKLTDATELASAFAAVNPADLATRNFTISTTKTTQKKANAGAMERASAAYSGYNIYDSDNSKYLSLIQLRDAQAQTHAFTTAYATYNLNDNGDLEIDSLEPTTDANLTLHSLDVLSKIDTTTLPTPDADNVYTFNIAYEGANFDVKLSFQEVIDEGQGLNVKRIKNAEFQIGYNKYDVSFTGYNTSGFDMPIIAKNYEPITTIGAQVETASSSQFTMEAGASYWFVARAGDMNWTGGTAKQWTGSQVTVDGTPQTICHQLTDITLTDKLISTPKQGVGEASAAGEWYYFRHGAEERKCDPNDLICIKLTNTTGTAFANSQLWLKLCTHE